MRSELRAAFDAEMAVAIDLYRKGRLGQSFGRLETAHVLGQRHVMPHVVTHWWMLKIGLKRRATSEVVGQAVRIVLGALGSAVGVVPVGNTGGTNISMFKRLPIDDGLRRLIE
ncbi:DUF3703 domain-containing protein [Noviherbaspirillum aridicola]|uniref:DUF3703 domain-containing protein n=1 Tax=Noviherbaspirillum aridicola TaxID=2849687 RepID=A0ABQ4Q3Y3_9BURK|nr:DUF3703 domain-containing protein [Noviherbaspirillum aridicola]GIZ51908.1 hypothetical protein NCCP691_19220 [Noviherbaspirillum aridicola]